MRRVGRSGIGALALVVVLGFGSFAAASASAHAGATTAAVPTAAVPTADCATLALHAHGPAVTTLQRALRVAADGDFGPQTQRALAAWQTAHKVKATGALDAATWTALPDPVAVAACGELTHGAGVGLSCTTLRTGAAGVAVQVLQTALSIKPDGAFGPQTAASVRAAQRRLKLASSGVVDAATWAALGLTGTPACVAAVEATRITKDDGSGVPSPAPSTSPSPSPSPSPSTSPSPKPKPSPVPPPPADAKEQAKVAAQVVKLAANLPQTPGTTTNPVASKALAFARSQAGKPYRWGGVGPAGYDCSGLVLASYLASGITMPRVAADQYGTGAAVPLDHAQQGDLLFYASDLTKPATIYHVVMYAGAGTIVDAPYTGAFVGTRQLWTRNLLPVAWRPVAPLTLPTKLGATGWTVAQLQAALVRHGAHLGVDGGFGPATQAAVKSWQTGHHLPATGVVDVVTWLTF